MTELKIPITHRAVLQRLNRVFLKDGKAVRTLRGESRVKLSASYVVIDLKTCRATPVPESLETFAKSRGLLHPWERLVD